MAPLTANPGTKNLGVAVKGSGPETAPAGAQVFQYRVEGAGGHVNTAEPDPSLFTVPSDYTVVNEKAMPFVIQKRELAQPPAPE